MDDTFDDHILRYPIGRFSHPGPVEPEGLSRWIDQLEALPAQFREVASRLSEAQLATPYRPGGWTLRQVIHHVPDSHMNAYVRTKWTLTEERPTIKAYDEVAWAELPDVAALPIAASLDLLAAIHARWVVLLRALEPADFAREFVHPVSGPIDLAHAVGTYAWHGRHHLAHLGLVSGGRG